jgi:hypothetical protein
MLDVTAFGADVSALKSARVLRLMIRDLLRYSPERSVGPPNAPSEHGMEKVEENQQPITELDSTISISP